jgi:uncharacterized protein YecE (DUF72 family)
LNTLRIGTAAWAIPRAVVDDFPAEGSNLQRYAARFNAVEINTSFYRPHRRATYERWSVSVPAGFRFAVKLPKTITHEARLADCDPLVARFAEEVTGLGDRRGPTLIQLPPSLKFDAGVAGSFFATLEGHLAGPAVCEPRHPSWFTAEAEQLLTDYRIARVAADPAPVPGAGEPGGWDGLAYFRLHGSPRIYWSGYDPPAREAWADKIAPFAARGEAWVIFDNTASGRATSDALAFQRGV